MYFKNKKILVCGGGKSGIEVCKLLLSLGSTITLFDEKEVKVQQSLRDKIEVVIKNSGIDIIENKDLIVVSPGIPLSKDYLLKAKEIGIKIVSEVEIANMLTSNKIVGITGTNGKTTTSKLIDNILNVKGSKVKGELVGNIGVPFTEKVMESEEDTIFIVELSSYQLETTHTLNPCISLIINISNDHLERHGTVQNYIEAKKRIFQNAGKKEIIILNYDDDHCRNMINDIAQSKIIYFSRDSKLNYGLLVENNKIYFKTVNSKKMIIELNKVQLIGEHNVENILGGVAVCLCLNIPIEQIREGVYSFKGVEHRLEYIRSVNGMLFINDSKATNEQSTINAIKSFEKKVILILGGVEKETVDFELIRLINKKVKHVILFGENTSKLKKCLKNVKYEHITEATTLDDVVEKSLEIGKGGEIVLFSPGYKSFDMFKNYEVRGNKYKEIVLNIKKRG